MQDNCIIMTLMCYWVLMSQLKQQALIIIEFKCLALNKLAAKFFLVASVHIFWDILNGKYYPMEKTNVMRMWSRTVYKKHSRNSWWRCIPNMGDRNANWRLNIETELHELELRTVIPPLSGHWIISKLYVKAEGIGSNLHLQQDLAQKHSLIEWCSTCVKTPKLHIVMDLDWLIAGCSLHILDVLKHVF